MRDQRVGRMLFVQFHRNDTAPSRKWNNGEPPPGTKRPGRPSPPGEGKRSRSRRKGAQ